MINKRKYCLIVVILLLLGASFQSSWVMAGSVQVGPRIEIYRGLADQIVPSAAFDSVNQRFLVAWTDWHDASAIFVKGQIINADGSLYGGTMDISQQTGSQSLINGNHVIKTIAFDPVNQRFLVAFTCNRDGYWRVFGQVLNADGSLYGDTFVISPSYLEGPPSPDFGMWAGNPVVSFNAANNKYLVVYPQDMLPVSNSAINVYAQYVNADGSLSGERLPLTANDPYYAVNLNISFDPGSGHNLVTWIDQYIYNGYLPKLYGRLLNADGSFQGSEIPIADNVGIGDLANDPINGKFLKVWNWAGGGVGSLLISADGNLTGSQTSIFGGLHGSAPAVIFDRVQRKFLVTAFYNGITGQYLNQDGTLFGDQFTITTLAADGAWPAMAFGTASSGSLVVWHDSNPDTGNDIYGALVKGPIIPLLPAVLNLLILD